MGDQIVCDDGNRFYQKDYDYTLNVNVFTGGKPYLVFENISKEAKVADVIDLIKLIAEIGISDEDKSDRFRYRGSEVFQKVQLECPEPSDGSTDSQS